jgi:hypothetical protein
LKEHCDLTQPVRIPGLNWEYIAAHASEWEVSDRLEALRELVARNEASTDNALP